MIRQLMAKIDDPKAFHYIVYSPVGPLTVDKWAYSVEGHVLIYGWDVDDKYRVVAFTEASALSFPIDIEPKASRDEKRTIGFDLSTGTLEDSDMVT